ncbi:MAG: phosphoribosylamine--glycine ligase [Chlorobiaceae bacterium]|nr:phosphoribosylamine--glycine ligase [Chlorobiaceae bacterium]MBA4308877.1 phosphoribosylamine--glycine ligase [Chlorobiaceae bacterium]
MKVLLIGGGGREHALALRIIKSKSCDKLFCLPGNTGTEKIAINISIDVNDFERIYEYISINQIELVVIGPEQPLVDGLADFLRNKSILVFGPNKLAAEIESDKSFAKNLMYKYGIPTAGYKVFTRIEYTEIKNYLEQQNFPIVIKASGLAAGKGVIICDNKSDAEKAIDEIVKQNIFDKAGDKIIIEEFMVGEEASIFAITDGTNFITLPAAQDHKRIGDNDTGKNTGGMGAYAPAQLITETLLNEISEKIISPTISALNAEGRKFIGCLYAGIMITDSGAKVVEFNCRFGDPETQVVLPLIDGDFLELLFSAAKENLKSNSVKYNDGVSVCVVTASNGYPDKFEKGFEIFGIENFVEENLILYHAGTLKKEDKIFTNGGRVLGVTSVVKKGNFQDAIKKAYEGVSKISYSNIYYRKDIGKKALKYSD